MERDAAVKNDRWFRIKNAVIGILSLVSGAVLVWLACGASTVSEARLAGSYVTVADTLSRSQEALIASDKRAIYALSCASVFAFLLSLHCLSVEMRIKPRGGNGNTKGQP